METKATSSRESNMITQVANSKGIEWMVSSYSNWQQRYNQQHLPQKITSSNFGLSDRFPRKETQLKNAMSFAFKFLVLLLGFIISG